MPEAKGFDANHTQSFNATRGEELARHRADDHVLDDHAEAGVQVNQGYEDMMAGRNIRGVIIHED
jgi:hypothetical protein